MSKNKTSVKKYKTHVIPTILGAFLLAGGVLAGVTLVLQPQIFNQQAQEIAYSCGVTDCDHMGFICSYNNGRCTGNKPNCQCTYAFPTATPLPKPRNMDCTFVGNKIYNPGTKIEVKNETGSELCYHLSTSRVIDGWNKQICEPINTNGCGNIGIWYSTQFEEANYKGYQNFYCTQDPQCIALGGKNYFCQPDLHRCYEDLETKYCSYLSQSSCGSAYFYDLHGQKRFCSWQPDSEAYSCQINWP